MTADVLSRAFLTKKSLVKGLILSESSKSKILIWVNRRGKNSFLVTLVKIILRDSIYDSFQWGIIELKFSYLSYNI